MKSTNKVMEKLRKIAFRALVLKLWRRGGMTLREALAVARVVRKRGDLDVDLSRKFAEVSRGRQILKKMTGGVTPTT